MPVIPLSIGDPFFDIKFAQNLEFFAVQKPSIVINASPEPIEIVGQSLSQFQSRIVMNTMLSHVKQAVIVERFDAHSDLDALYAEVQNAWPLAYEVRREERLKGKLHYISPKARVENVFISMYHTAGVPLNVGLHQEHVHHGEVPVREVHTQLVGYGKMQQCTEKDLGTLYLEESMAPGMTHSVMFDENAHYPWHQYETVTPGIVLALEIVPADRVEESPFSKLVERVG